MGILSKIWKGIKKTAKKIAKGVKKVFKKIGGAIGKLGVVGQLGMMFLMPYAAGALSSFAGSALSKVGTWSANLLSKSGVGAKALGHTLNMVHKAGTFAGKVYTTVSDTIGNAIDRVGNFAKGEGFVLSEGRTGIFAKGNERSLFSKEGYALPDPTTKDLKLTAKVNEKLQLKIDDNLNDKLYQDLELNGKKFLEAPMEVADVPSSILEPDVKFGGETVVTAPKIETDKNLFDRTKDFVQGKVQEGIETIKDYDPGKAVTKTMDNIIYSKGMNLAGVDTTPDYVDNSTYIDIPSFADMSNREPGVYEQADLMLQKQGNSFLVNNFANSQYINDLLNPQVSGYDAYMNEFARNQYTPIGA
jgi:hypothetical protein